MPSMTEDMGRIASGIAASRKARMDGAAGLHRDVGKQLQAMKTTREMMGRQQRKDLAAERHKLTSDVEVMMSRLHRSQVEAAAAQRTRLGMFVHDLTGSVEALRDAFSTNREARIASCRELTQAVHGRLSAYRRDRHDAEAAWRGTAARKAAPAPLKPMPQPYVRVEASPAMPSAMPAATPPSSPMASAPRPVEQPASGSAMGKNKSSS